MPQPAASWRPTRASVAIEEEYVLIFLEITTDDFDYISARMAVAGDCNCDQ
jgi:hypothetical protein